VKSKAATAVKPKPATAKPDSTPRPKRSAAPKPAAGRPDTTAS